MVKFSNETPFGPKATSQVENTNVKLWRHLIFTCNSYFEQLLGEETVWICLFLSSFCGHLWITFLVSFKWKTRKFCDVQEKWMCESVDEQKKKKNKRVFLLNGVVCLVTCFILWLNSTTNMKYYIDYMVGKSGAKVKDSSKRLSLKADWNIISPINSTFFISSSQWPIRGMLYLWKFHQSWSSNW